MSNLYFNQALLPVIASAYHATEARVALIVSASQIGYALGIVFVVPLGDRLNPRTLTSTLAVASGILLLAAGCAPTLDALLVLSLLIAGLTVIAQILIPYSIGQVDDGVRGATLARLQTGLVGGVLLSRAFAGTLAGAYGLRAPYLFSGCAMLLLAFALRLTLRTVPREGVQPSYPAMLASLFTLVRRYAEVRLSCALGAATFGAYIAVLGSVAFFAHRTYGFGPAQIGLLALASFPGALAAPLLGRQGDRFGPDRISAASLLCFGGGIALVGCGAHGLAYLIVGLNVMTFAQQVNQVANQTRIFGVAPEARSRTNTLYMFSAFSGGAMGSLAAAPLYARGGWSAVCAGAFVFVSIALVTVLPRGRRRGAPSP